MSMKTPAEMRCSEKDFHGFVVNRTRIGGLEPRLLTAAMEQLQHGVGREGHCGCQLQAQQR